MINKTASSPREFQPSETIKETTVALRPCTVRFSLRGLVLFTECLQVETSFLFISTTIRGEPWLTRRSTKLHHRWVLLTRHTDFKRITLSNY